MVLLDRSGSMASIREDMIGGFNTFVEKQRKEPGKANLTLVQFDSEGIEDVYVSIALDKVPLLKLEPRGSTPLLDAMGHTIAETQRRLKSFKGNVIFLVVTDGMENASHEYTKDAVKKMVDERTKAGWGFVYLAANVNAFDEAGKVGIMASNAINYAPSSKGTNKMYDIASRAASMFRSATPTSLKVANISAEDRDEAMEEY